MCVCMYLCVCVLECAYVLLEYLGTIFSGGLCRRNDDDDDDNNNKNNNGSRGMGGVAPLCGVDPALVLTNPVV